MTPQIVFALFAALLVLAVLAIVVPPLWRSPNAASRRCSNRARR